jgi:hypothetical protein
VLHKPYNIWELVQGSGQNLEGSRIFKPEEIYGPDVDMDAVTQCDGNFTYVPLARGKICNHCNKLHVHTDAIIIAISGRCKTRNRQEAEGSVGIFFGNRSPYSKSSLLSTDLGEHTNQLAELVAGLIALHLQRIFTMMGR